MPSFIQDDFFKHARPTFMLKLCIYSQFCFLKCLSVVKDDIFEYLDD